MSGNETPGKSAAEPWANPDWHEAETAAVARARVDLKKFCATPEGRARVYGILRQVDAWGLLRDVAAYIRVERGAMRRGLGGDEVIMGQCMRVIEDGLWLFDRLQFVVMQVVDGGERDLFWDPERQRKRPEVVCRAKAGHAYEDDSPQGGGSYRVGERSSNRMLRVYDKAAQSGGVVDAIRWELECKGRVAAAAMEAMAQPFENRSAAALRYLVGFLDFREVLRGLASGKRPRCRWWAELVASAEGAIVGPPERGGLEEWRATFCRQNSSGFRLLVTLNGGDLGVAAAELLEATSRDNPRHQAWRRDVLRNIHSKGPGSGGAAA